VIHRLQFLRLTPVLFLISLCFHRQGASVFATERADLKLDAQNEPGVFFRVDHLENTFGAVILVKQSLVVARHNVFFVESVFPFKEKKPSFTHWESLHKLIGRKNAITEVHDFDNLLPDTRSDLEPAAASQSHQTQPHDSSSRALDVDSVDLSSDDDEVEIFLSKLLKMCRLNPFLLSILFRHHQFEVPLSGPRLAFYLLVMGGKMRKLKKIQGTWVQPMTLMILSQGGRSARPKS